MFAMFMIPAASISSPSNNIRLRIPAQYSAKLVGAAVLGRIDYGTFSIVEVSRDTAATLKSSIPAAIEDDPDGLIGLQDRPFNTRLGAPVLSATLKAVETPGTPMFYLIKMKGPIKPEWITEITDRGGLVAGYLPQNTYLVWIDPASVSSLSKLDFITWKGVYQPGYKISKTLDGAAGTIDYLSVVIYDDLSGKTIDKIKSYGATLVRKMTARLSFNAKAETALFSADASIISRIARLPHVMRVERTSAKPGLDDEVACKIVSGQRTGGIPQTTPSYNYWLQQKGVDGTGSTVAVVDTGCDTNNNDTAHLDLRGRLSSIVIYPFTPNTDLSGHGTHVAGIVAGNAAVGTTDPDGFLYGQGVAPGCNLVIQNAVTGQFPPYGEWSSITSDGYWNGAFVSNNSWFWSSDPGAGYTTQCQAMDLLVRDADPNIEGIQPITMVFSLGNGGPDVSTIFDPKEAKNIITVGASENYRVNPPLPGGCGASSNIDGVADFSSRGPCMDGRLAPTVVAPGTHISSAISYSAVGVGGYNDPYDPCKAIATTDYAWMSGTSQAAPMVSGALALIGQWWRANHNSVNPSPAMCKAIIVNSADDLAGGPDGRGGTLGHIPNNDQGWGRLNIDAAINPPNTSYEDQAYLFTSTGQSRSYRVKVVDPTKPLKITLAWSDALGTPGSYGWTNDLDLTVTGESGTYYGNIFLNGWSRLAPGRDEKNNIECVFIQSPSDIYIVTITAANVAGDGVPGNSYSFDQDFALVVRNGSVGGDHLEPYSPVTSIKSASPDYYNADTSDGGWCAVGLRPDPPTDHDITVYTEPGYITPIKTSATRGSGLDFVAIDGNNVASGTLYPLVSTYGGKGGYKIEWATRTSDLISGVTENQSFDTSNVLRIWDIEVGGPASCGVRVQPTSGNVDVGISIFGSTYGSQSTYYRSRQQSIVEADAAGAGQSEIAYFQLPAAGRYAVLVWSKSGAGDYSVLLDDDPPTIPEVTPASPYTADLTQLGASWQSTDPETGITKYEYAIGSTPGATDVVGWTDVGTTTNVTRGGLTLIPGQNYYFSVRATNGMDMTGQVGTSSAILAVQSVSTIPAVKALPDGSVIMVTSKPITAAFLARFYIIEPDRSSGIGVIWGNDVIVGANVTAVGSLTTIAGERFIQAIDVLP